MKSTITIEQLISELRSTKPDDEGYTVEEWCEHTGMGTARIRKTIRDGIKCGLVIRGTAMRENIRGAMVQTMVYRLAKKGRK
jgi:hypothetical protein